MNDFKALAASWSRSFMAGALTLALAGETDIKKLALAGLAAIAPVVLRWLNPADKAFGVK